MKPEWEELHRQAVAQGLNFYQDPATGNWVATELVLRQQGRCCDSGCRHCPYTKPDSEKPIRKDPQ